MSRIRWKKIFCLGLVFSVVLVPNEEIATARPVPPPQIDPHAPPPPAPDNPPLAPPVPGRPDPLSRESLRRFVVAFLRARGEPSVDEELRFFATRVDYLDRPHLSQSDLRRELLRLRKEWPERHFTLAGALTIQTEGRSRTNLTFPVRYEFQKGPARKHGEFNRTLVLSPTGPNDFKITALQERPPSH